MAGYEYQVINAGVSGDTSGRALRRFEPVLEGDVRILIVALGANDGLRGVSVQQLKSNLSQIIDEAQRRAISVLLCGMEAPPMRGWDYSVSFHRAYDELCGTLSRAARPISHARIVRQSRPDAAGSRSPQRSGRSCNRPPDLAVPAAAAETRLIRSRASLF